MKQQFIKDTADTFRTYIYENNRKIVPASALLTAYKPGGDALVVDGAVMTVGSDGLLSYALSAADNSALGENYKAVVSYVHNSATWYVTLFYDIVNSRLSKVITDSDIVSELPQLKDNGWKVRGMAEGGSATIIVDTELKRYEDDHFTGGLAYSAAKDETREVTGFNSSTGTVTIAGFSSAVSAGERYTLTRSYSKEIQRAFEKLEERLIRLGKRPELILDPYDLREAHIGFSVAEVCKGMTTGSEDFWWEMWKDYEKKAEEAFRSINFKYDSSGDGYIASGEADADIKTIRAGRR
ncbi:MAG: hypothetical protein Q8P48_04885 [Deltaproteobacteria bacterium]|nr:hypothetical protein [Deltaproteobacteria bacterium]